MKKQLLIISAIFIGSITLLSLNSNEMSQEPWEVPAKYKKMKNPYLDKSDSENIGRILYSKHCKSCHGKKGLGDGTKAESVDTKMPDLTSADFKTLQRTGAVSSLIMSCIILSWRHYGGSKKYASQKHQW